MLRFYRVPCRPLTKDFLVLFELRNFGQFPLYSGQTQFNLAQLPALLADLARTTGTSCL